MPSGTKVSSEKRFILPKENIGRLRLEATQEIIGDIKRDYPEVLSLCAFGSSTNGESSVKSDIDGWLFVDTDLLSKKLKCDENEVVNHEVRDNGYSKTKVIRLQEGIRDRYNFLFREPVKQMLGLDDDQVKHIRAVPISEALVDELVDDLSTWDKKMVKYQNDRREIEEKLNRHETDINITSYRMPDSPSFGLLSSMFHLAIGKGIEKYRSMLITKLENMGEGGDRIWKEIIERTEMMENHSSTGTNKNYPKTLEQAKVIYN